MMFTFVSVIIAVSLLVLTVLGSRSQTKDAKKKYFGINLGISLFSALFGLFVVYLAHNTIFSGEQAAEWQEWAWDAFILFVKTTLPVFGCALMLILLTTVVTTLVSQRTNVFSTVVRQAASLALSVILLFITPFYAAMAETSEANVHVFVLLFGICEALFMRLSFVLEGITQIIRSKKS